MNVAVLGASDKPDRYSYRAIKMLIENGHKVFPVHPVLKTIDGIPVYKGLGDIAESIDTITVYLSPPNSTAIADVLLGSNARRVVFNPGAENPALARQLREKGREVVQACTLVMLSTGQF